MDEATAQARLETILADFSRDQPKASLRSLGEALDANRFPVPELVFYGLARLMRFPSGGRGEKIAWSVWGSFRSFGFSIAHEKFGPNLYYDARMAPTDKEQLLVKLGAVVTVVEQYLETLANEQISKGNITLANNFHYLDFAYHHLRKLAEAAYDRPDQELFDQLGESMGHELMAGAREGSALSAAMTDAYFSRLEHVLVLMPPFVAMSCAAGALQEFIEAKWSSKLKKIFDLAREPEAEKQFQALHGVKEGSRNVLSHGGFHKGSGSMHVHIPGLGAIPARMSGIRDQLQIGLIFPPISKDTFQSMCQIFDEFDAFLANSKTSFGWKWVTAGLDVAYDAQTCAEYGEAMKSEKAFERLLDKASWEQTNAINMDW